MRREQIFRIFDFHETMTISNDIITIEQSDFLSFSAEAQSAISFRAGVQAPWEYLSVRFNAVIQESLDVERKARIDDPQNQVVTIAFAKASILVQNQVEVLLGVS